MPNIQYFNFTPPGNITGAEDIINYSNNMVNYAMGPLLLAAVFIVCLISFHYGKNPAPESITASLWITSLIGIFASLIPSFLDSGLVIALFIVTGLSTLLLWDRR